MSEVLAHRCKEPKCTVAANAKCIEGLPLADCPNYLGSESAELESTHVEESFELDSKVSGENKDDQMVDLPEGSDLSPSTATRVTRSRLTRVVVIAGDQDSGKTTLVSSLYDRLQDGPFSGYNFAGCDTIPGLERRCFPSRIESDQMNPDTIRTPRGDGQSLLHLRLRTADSSRPAQDLLLSDISGEFFRDACDSTEGCRQLKILRRADHVALCLDGEKLGTLRYRHEAFQTGKLLLQSALDADMIGRKTYVDILFTKRDLLGPPGDPAVRKYLHNISEDLKRDLAQRLGRLRFFEVAARPTRTGFPFAFGLDRILPSWVEDTPLYDQSPIDFLGFAGPLAQTEFDRYLLRRPKDLGF